jgi:F0F1-type ATP synthase membrane subunit b/b'
MRLRRRTAPLNPLEQAEPAMAAIRRAEEAAAVLLAAHQADQAEISTARRQAEELLTAASLRARQLAERRREAIRAEFDAQMRREHEDAEAAIAQLNQAARDGHDPAVRQAVTFVLTGEAAPCSSL